jgi:hypothetical protein
VPAAAIGHGVQDCNGNGIPDDLEIKLGLVEDCNGNGIPDECEVVANEVLYQHDTGQLWGGLGTDVSPNQTIAWMSRFVVEKGATSITGVQLAYGVIPEGFPVTIAVWSDPDGDGVPFDAQVLVSVETTVQSPWLPLTFVDVPLPETELGPPGTSFFIGAFMSGVPMTPAAFPAAFDCGAGCSVPDSSGESWWIATPGPFNPNDVSEGAVEFGTIADVTGGTLYADFLLRGTFCATGFCGLAADLNGNGVPDECEADCNGNGIPDDLDILLGNSTDCNGNGIPDECERLEDCDGDGVADICQAQGTGLVGRYHPNTNLAGEFVSRIDPEVFFDLSSFPLPPGIPNSDFSIRWVGSLVVPKEGVTELALRRDDGARLFIDGIGLIDRWTGSGGDLEVAAVDLKGGEVRHLRIEYLQLGGGGLLEFMWRRAGGPLEMVPSAALRPIFDLDGDGRPDLCDASDCNGNFLPDDFDIAMGLDSDCDGNGVPDSCQLADGDCDGDGFFDLCGAGATGLVGQYFLSYNPVNGNPQGGRTTERVGTRLDANIDFPWGDDGPGIGGIGQSYYTVLWRGVIVTPAVDGVYTFSVQHDDGVRLWIGDERVIDNWNNADTTTTGSIALAGGTAYRFRMDYYNGIGGGRAILRWVVPGGSLETIPTEAFLPIDDLDGNGVPDACDLDCNGNGIPDALEIGLGLALDCNGNGVPDECDVAFEPVGKVVFAHWRFEDPKDLGADSGPNGLAAVIVSASGQSEVPLPAIPSSGAANEGSLRFGAGGHLRVADPQGLVSLGAQPFTVEAWVHLDELGAATAAGRQWLFARKPSENGDANIDWGVLAQIGDYGTSTAATNRYGRTGDFTGREIALTFGFGSGGANQQKAVICPPSLRIDETGWHFIAVSFDPFRRVARFTLNGAIEEVVVDRIWFVGNPAAVPLTIGARPAGGGFDQFLRGAVDEIRISNGVLDQGRLLATPYTPFSLDLDGDGVPDECDGGAGCPADLTVDGSIDGADLSVLLSQWGGSGSADFDGNGIVDGSDLATLLAAWGPCR